jgi:two-component SAPR family response regulator
LSPPARAVTSRAEADPVAASHDSDPAAELAADDAPPPGVDGGVTAEPGDVPVGPVQVRVLGAPHVVGVDATTGEPLRPQSLELLVYLATRGDTLRETVLEDVLGDVPHSKAPARLNTYVYNLRRVLKRVGGPQTYVEHPPHGRYWLNTDAFDIDLWRMRTALTEADTATDPHTRIAALRRAVDAYPGPLADGHDYVWIEPYREGVRQQALDAHLALAGALIDQPAEALAVVTATITHDPYAETLYQHAMRLHAQLGDMDAIRGLRRTLTRRLAEIDAEPGDDTIALAERLVADLHRHQRRRRDDDTAA